jgi:hypothetical protein
MLQLCHIGGQQAVGFRCRPGTTGRDCPGRWIVLIWRREDSTVRCGERASKNISRQQFTSVTLIILGGSKPDAIEICLDISSFDAYRYEFACHIENRIES